MELLIDIESDEEFDEDLMDFTEDGSMETVECLDDEGSCSDED